MTIDESEFNIQIDALPGLSEKARGLARHIRSAFLIRAERKGRPVAETLKGFIWSMRDYGASIAEFLELQAAGLVVLESHLGMKRTHFTPRACLFTKKVSDLEIDRRQIARLKTRGYVIGLALHDVEPTETP